MSEFNTPNIFYLEPKDFDDQFNLIIRPDIPSRTGTPLFGNVTIIMIQGNFCGYCTRTKPTFQRIADELMAADFATIKIDGEDKEFFRTHIDHIVKGQLKGVPTFVKLYQGKVVDIYVGDTSHASLVDWIYG